MTKGRFKQLESDMNTRLTEQELAEGWHFCPDWDGMLIHRDHPEIEACLCARFGRRNL